MVDRVDWEDERQAEYWSRRRGQSRPGAESYPWVEDQVDSRYKPRESTPRYPRRGDSMPPPPEGFGRREPYTDAERDYHGFRPPPARRRSLDDYYADSSDIHYVDEGDYEEYYDYDEVLDGERDKKSGLWDYEDVPPSYAPEGLDKDSEPQVRRHYEYLKSDHRKPRRPYGTMADEDREGYRGRTLWDQMGFYNFFWDPRYNVKIPVMQIVAIVSLVIIFILNYNINITFVEILGDFSPYVAIQQPELAWVFALMLALFISVIPSMDREFRLQITLWVIIIIILFFISYPAITFFATYDMMEVGRALANSLIEFLKIIAVLIYWAPILLAVYGIFNRERFYVFLAVLFILGIIIFTDLYMLGYEIPHHKDASNIPLYTVFALALFCFYEMSDSSITFFSLNESPQTWDAESAHQMHLERILQKYFMFFIIFSALALVLTVPILSFNEVLSALGSQQVGESVELNSIYGTIVSLFVIILFLIFIGYLIRYEYDIKKLIKKYFGNFLTTRTEVRRNRDIVRFDDEYDLPPPPPSDNY